MSAAVVTMAVADGRQGTEPVVVLEPVAKAGLACFDLGGAQQQRPPQVRGTMPHR
jgi:hypothetical protein